MPDQDFTLSLKMTADGASAVQESAHLADNLERALAAARELSRVSPTPGNATHSPSSAAQPSGPDSAPSPKIALLASVMRTFAGETDRSVSAVQGLTGAVTAFGERAATVQGAIGQAAQTTQDNTKAQTRNAEAQRQSAQATEANARAARASEGGVLSSVGKIFGAIGKGISSVFGIFKRVVSGVWEGLKAAVSFVLAPFKLAWEGVKTVLKAVAGVLAAVVGAGYGAVKLLSPAGDAELSETRLSLQLGSRAKGRRRFAELRDYSRSSGYSMQAVGATHNALHVAGMYSRRHLEALGNAANAFGKSLPELANAVMMLKNGGGSMGLRSLRQYGVSNDVLKRYGVKFKKSGELRSSGEKVAEAVMRYFEDRFRHSTAIVGGTWKATLQQASVEVTDAFAMGFRGALKPATAYVRDHLIPAITEIGKYFASLDWNKILATPLKILSGITDAFRQLASLDMHNLGVENLKAIGTALWEVGKELVKYFANVAIGIIKDFFNHFGGVGEVFKKAFDSLSILLKASLDALGIVLESASDGLVTKIKKFVFGEDVAEGKQRGDFEATTGGLLIQAAGYHLNEYGKAVADHRSTEMQRQEAIYQLTKMGFSPGIIALGIKNLKNGQYVHGAGGAGGMSAYEGTTAYKALREANYSMFDYYENLYVEDQLYSLSASRKKIESFFNDAQQQMGKLYSTWHTGKPMSWENFNKAKDDTEGLSNAIRDLGSAAAVSSYELKMYNSGPFGREAVRMHNYLLGLKYPEEDAVSRANEWMKLLIDTDEKVMWDRAHAKHMQFISTHRGEEDVEWNEFKANKGKREFDRLQLRGDKIKEWEDNAPNKASNSQASYRQEMQNRQVVTTLENVKTEIVSLHRFLMPVVNAYKQQGSQHVGA